MRGKHHATAPAPAYWPPPNAMDAADLTEAAQWSTGIVSEDATGAVQVESRLFYQGTVEGGGTANELSRLTDAREKGRIGILGSALSYAGSYGRVTSESIGRDLNPLGRGDGGAYVAGGMNLGRISPALPGNMSPGGWGNSVNNCGVNPVGPSVFANPDHPPSVFPGLDEEKEDEHLTPEFSPGCTWAMIEARNKEIGDAHDRRHERNSSTGLSLDSTYYP